MYKHVQRRKEKLQEIFDFMKDKTTEELSQQFSERELMILTTIRDADESYMPRPQVVQSLNDSIHINVDIVERAEIKAYKIQKGLIQPKVKKPPTTNIHQLDCIINLTKALSDLDFNDQQIKGILNHCYRNYHQEKDIDTIVKDYVCDIHETINIIIDCGFTRENALTIISTKPSLADFSYLEAKKKMFVTDTETFHPLELILPVLLKKLGATQEEIMNRISEILKVEEPSVFMARHYYMKKEGSFMKPEARNQALLGDNNTFSSCTAVTLTSLMNFYESVNQFVDKDKSKDSSYESKILKAINAIPSPRRVQRLTTTKGYMNNSEIYASEVDRKHQKRVRA